MFRRDAAWGYAMFGVHWTGGRGGHLCVIGTPPPLRNNVLGFTKGLPEVNAGNASSQLSRGLRRWRRLRPAATMFTLHFERTLLNGEPEGL